jgi:hypothetical protein
MVMCNPKILKLDLKILILCEGWDIYDIENKP